jgi:hypothetical protein
MLKKIFLKEPLKKRISIISQTEKNMFSLKRKREIIERLR